MDTEFNLSILETEVLALSRDGIAGSVDIITITTILEKPILAHFDLVKAVILRFELGLLEDGLQVLIIDLSLILIPTMSLKRSVDMLQDVHFVEEGVEATVRFWLAIKWAILEKGTLSKLLDVVVSFDHKEFRHLETLAWPLHLKL